MSKRWTTTANGVIALRTQNLGLKEAEMMLTGFEQIPGVAHAEVIASGTNAYVQWVPEGQAAQEQLYLELMQEEVRKALAEMGEYQFMPTGNGGAFVVSKEKANGTLSTYLVQPDLRCECPHFVYRCNAAGLWCKHGIAWKLKRSGQTVVPAQEVREVRGMDQSEMARAIARDFD